MSNSYQDCNCISFLNGLITLSINAQCTASLRGTNIIIVYLYSLLDASTKLNSVFCVNEAEIKSFIFRSEFYVAQLHSAY